MQKLLVIALAVAGISAPALAQDAITDVAPAVPSVSFDTSVLASTDFATIDADASGGVSFEELAALVPDLSQDDFNALDTDMNGELSADEYGALSGGASMTTE